MNFIDTIRSFQSNFLPAQEKFWVYQSIIDMLENYKDHLPSQKSELEATRLIQYFQCYGIDIPNDKRKAYSIFSSLQHINLITHPKMDIEELVYWMEVVSEINKRQ
jgi:argininosuccinate synthase